MAVERWGAEELKKYLRKLATGELITWFCFTEPLARSDANSILTTAEEQEKEVIVSRKKKWMTMVQIAEVFCLSVK